jgi:hypothetical protein
MTTQNNKGIKYSNKTDVQQKIKIVTETDKKTTMKSIIDMFLTSVKLKHQ